MRLIAFGATGFKARLWAAAGGLLFAGAVLGTETLSRLFPGALLPGWLLAAAVAAGLFYRVCRTDDEGSIEITFLHALVPWPLWVPALFWGIAAEDGPPSWGHWPVLGEVWTGAGLYAVLLGATFTYNLLRLNIMRSLRRR